MLQQQLQGVHSGTYSTTSSIYCSHLSIHSVQCVEPCLASKRCKATWQSWAESAASSVALPGGGNARAGTFGLTRSPVFETLYFSISHCECLCQAAVFLLKRAHPVLQDLQLCLLPFPASKQGVSKHEHPKLLSFFHNQAKFRGLLAVSTGKNADMRSFCTIPRQRCCGPILGKAPLLLLLSRV